MTTISWTKSDDGSLGETWNPIAAFRWIEEAGVRVRKRGWFCTPVHGGCKFCYAGAINERRGNGLAYQAQHLGEVEFELLEHVLLQPLAWRKPRRCFVCSMTDLYAPWVPDEWLDKIKAVQALTPHITYIELTKRPARMRDYLLGDAERRSAKSSVWLRPLSTGAGRHARDIQVDATEGWARWPLPNVVGGPSCSTQADAEEFVPIVLTTPLAKRIVSLEPLLGPVDLADLKLNSGMGFDALRASEIGRSSRVESWPPLDGVFVGFESESDRQGKITWIRDIIAACRAAGTACFVKQLGSRPILEVNGKPVALRMKDRKGENPAEWPEDLRVREFPAMPPPAAAAKPQQLELLS